MPPVPPSTTDTRVNVTSTYSGTVIHELAHQLDRIWNDWSQTTTSGWRINLQADIANFNTGTCATKVDADRIASSLPAVCSLPQYAGKTNYEILLLASGWNDYEMWALAFSNAFPTTVNPPYYPRVFNRFTNIKTYMQDLQTSGGNPT